MKLVSLSSNTRTLMFGLKLALLTACFLVTTFAFAATLSVSPATGVYSAGQTFSVKVLVNTSGAAINAADGTLKFNPQEISVVSVSKGSIFNLWTADPAFSNTAGTLTFSGGSPTGYTGASGAVMTVTFKAKAAGSPKVSFTSGSVLAADGRGTNVLTKMNGGAYTISAQESTPEAEVIVEYVPPANTPAAPKIESSTHPDQNSWYNTKNAELKWNVPSGVTAVRTLLDNNPTAIPTKVYEQPISSISLTDLSEGVSYFHIQFKNSDGWGRVTHYKLATDSEKPTKFEIASATDNDPSNPAQKLALVTTDTTSKVKRFMVQLDGGQPYEFIDSEAKGVLTLPSLVPGRHTVIIEAFDEAQNGLVATYSFEIEAFSKPQFTEFPQEINEQVIPVIKGTTRPGAKVAVTMTQLGIGASSVNTAQVREVVSDDKGQFVFMPDGRLSLGVYELTAVATDTYGAQSEPSDPIRIAVQQPGYLKVGSFIVSFLSVLVPLIALIAVLILGSLYSIARLRRLRFGVSKEAKEAHKMLTSEFTKLREALHEQKKLLEASRKNGKLTKSEEDVFTAISSSLKEGEARVSKEIVDVEDLV